MSKPNFFDRHPNWKASNLCSTATRLDKIVVAVDVKHPEIDDEWDEPDSVICFSASISYPNALNFKVGFKGTIFLPEEIRTLEQAVNYIDEKYPMMSQEQQLDQLAKLRQALDAKQKQADELEDQLQNLSTEITKIEKAIKDIDGIGSPW